MAPDKAIKTLDTHQSGISPTLQPELHKSLQLGIEALRHYKKAKELGDIPHQFYLPGETED